MGKRRRDRIVEVGALKGNKTTKNTGGVCTGFDILKLNLEELMDRRSLGAIGSLEETDKE